MHNYDLICNSFSDCVFSEVDESFTFNPYLVCKWIYIGEKEGRKKVDKVVSASMAWQCMPPQLAIKWFSVFEFTKYSYIARLAMAAPYGVLSVSK